MSYQTEILEACQDYGLVLGKNLLEYAGWRTRGSEIFDPHGSVNHHTAGPRTGDLPSLNTLIFGRPDLEGPLCNAALSRSAVIHLIAAGRANHAGLGGWAGLSGNSSVWGLEVEHTGYADEAVSAARWDAMYRWHRACMDVSGFSSASVCQHFEWAPSRKIDFCKPLIPNPSAFRTKVSQVSGDVMNATQEAILREVRADVNRLMQALQPRSTQTVITSGDDIGKVDPSGEAGVGDIWRWLVYLELERQGRAGHTDLQDRIARKVVEALPPAAGGGLTEAQIQAATEAGIRRVLGGLG